MKNEEKTMRFSNLTQYEKEKLIKDQERRDENFKRNTGKKE